MGVFSRKSKDANAEPAEDSVTPKAADPEPGGNITTEHKEIISTAPTSDDPNSKWALSSHTADGDTAQALFSNPDDLHEEMSPQDQARLQRKIDYMILPYLAVCYAFFYIDKTTLSYAAIFGIREDLNLVGTEYNWLSSIFYFGFLIWACEFAHPPLTIQFSVNIVLTILCSPNKLHDATLPYW